MPRLSSAPRLFYLALAASLTVSALLFFLWSWHWPLVGDASLMHYIAFLIQRGWAPYRDFGDMDMPGAFLIEMAAMRIFGAGALAWRIFDFTLLALASASFFAMTKPDPPLNPGAPFATASPSRVGSRWLAPIFASSLFILIHGRDGLEQGGQRDLTMAVCLIAATAFLVHALRRRSVWPIAAFGLLSGIAVTVKPTALLLTLAQLAIALYTLRTAEASNQQRRASNGPCLLAVSALFYLVAPAIALIFLLRERALTAFLSTLHTVVPYYASLGHRPIGYLLQHSLSPVLSLFLIWLAILALNRPLLLATLKPSHDGERAVLLAGVLFGFFHCVVQSRALPYHRYPLLMFLLPLMATDFIRTATNPVAPFVTAAPSRVGSRQVASVLSILALAIGGFFLAPQSAILIHRYRWAQTDLITSLQQDLNSLGGPQLSGHIQCIDWVSGCGNVLYLMRLEPATGVLSDFLLFGSGDAPAVQHTRDQFSAAILANPPQVIVVTSRLYLGDPGDAENYAKLDRWPAFAAVLATRYTLQTEWTPTRTERWWSREEKPAGYRIYVLRP